MIQQEIETLLAGTVRVSSLKLENESHLHSGPATESHFKLILVSPDFEEKSKVQRHRMIYQILKETMKKIHALALHLHTPREWEEAGFHVADTPNCADKRQTRIG